MCLQLTAASEAILWRFNMFIVNDIAVKEKQARIAKLKNNIFRDIVHIKDLKQDLEGSEEASSKESSSDLLP